jgi:hypothetical protein
MGQGYFIPDMHMLQRLTEKGQLKVDRKGRKKPSEGGKRSKWGHVVPERSSRIANDGRTSLEKAKENKKKEDLEENYAKCRKL